MVEGERPVTVGGGGRYRKGASPVALVPEALVTVTCTVWFAVPGGAVAVICVALLSVKLALTPPNLTTVAPEKLVPVSVTTVPPLARPSGGEQAQ